MPLVEAQAAGMPVITLDSQPMNEWFTNLENGEPFAGNWLIEAYGDSVFRSIMETIPANSQDVIDAIHELFTEKDATIRQWSEVNAAASRERYHEMQAFWRNLLS